MQIVYIIQNNNSKETYIGTTSNLKSRLKNHNSGGNKSTKRKNGKWILIYAEAFKSKEDAIIREDKLKHHGSAKRALYNRIENSFL